mgnify:FL=1
MNTRTTLETVYVTKYGLTQGILKYHNAEHCVDVNRGMIAIPPVTTGYLQYFHKPDWYEDENEARLRVVAMKNAKTMALQKKIDKLDTLNPMRMPITEVTS